MKNLFLIICLIVLTCSLYSIPHTPYPSPIALNMDFSLVFDIPFQVLQEMMKFDYHFNFSPNFSLYPRSAFPYFRVNAGLSASLCLPLNIFLSLSSDLGLLINPMIDFTDKWLDTLLTAGIKGFGGFRFNLYSNINLYFGGRMILEYYMSLIYPSPPRFYYSGELVLGLMFDFI